MRKASCAIMFADVSGSTRLYDDHGNEVAKKIIDTCLGCLQVITETHQGVVIKKIGDELMCRFDNVAAAISAARLSQAEFQSLQVDENIKLSIRAGIHFGEVIEDENDIFGDAVNVAARMAGIAKSGQIITTQSSVDELPAEMTGQVHRFARSTSLESRVSRLKWQSTKFYGTKNLKSPGLPLNYYHARWPTLKSWNYAWVNSD